ncbi:UNVERIFIED_CONTAM: hypothetical protein Sradi_2503600 [Sesamum radiatum]|uniref:Reverse transcriptase zinc-binding domain-containing protein n=1 Tax=Sesamum radiatum TaxID=300843 RepID=A0AAW2SM42_SESRA
MLTTSKMFGGLALCDLRAFNSPVLAKKFWRLFIYPELLLGQLLKVRYYPDFSILEAELGSRPSFIWRSVSYSKPIILAGHRWRIGDGHTVKIWIYPWIPGNSSYRSSLHLEPLPPPKTVNHLFTAKGGDWNVPLIESMFPAHDAQAILCIPICRTGMQDEIIWHYTQSGSLLVKSAYHLACHNDRHSNPSSSHSNSPYFRTGWMSIWNTKIPNKIKVFAWRLCNDALLVGSNVKQRLPFSDICCLFCYEQDDNIRHTFFLCPFSRMVWCISHLRWSVIYNWQTNARDWVFHAHKQLEATDFDLFLLSVGVFGGVETRSSLKGYHISLTKWFPLHEVIWTLLRRLRSIPSFNTTTIFALWHPPENSFVKINYDVAFFLDTSDFGISVIARDHKGNCLAWLSQRLHRTISPELTEAWAARAVIDLGIRFKWDKIITEGDCVDLVKQLVDR